MFLTSQIIRTNVLYEKTHIGLRNVYITISQYFLFDYFLMGREARSGLL